MRVKLTSRMTTTFASATNSISMKNKQKEKNKLIEEKNVSENRRCAIKIAEAAAAITRLHVFNV